MSDKVRWGILGTARIATKVGAAIRNAPDSELSVIGSRDGKKAASWAKEHNAAHSVESYEAVIDNPEIDAVYIPLPPSMHHEWTLKAAEKGKHVLCEKPLAGDVSPAKEMAAACRENNVQLMDGVMWLHHPRSDDMKAILKSDALGDFKRYTAAFSFCWDTVPENDLRLQRALGGGSLLDLGWYCAGGSLWAFDEMPVRVQGHATWYNDVDMNLSATMWYSDGKVASFDCGFDTVMRRWFEVAGTKSSLVCDDFTRPYTEDKVRCWVHNPDGTSVEHTSEIPNQETCMINDFNRIVLTGKLNDHWPDIAVKTQQICAAIDESARSGKIVELKQD